MEIDYSKNQSILNFLSACNEFIEGKFILADIKIAKILGTISQSTEIYELVAECMINYDFEKEYAKAKVKSSAQTNVFQLPLENHKIIPLVFCLLVELDSKKINFNDFIRTQFPYANGQKEEYDAFSNNIVVPFRNSIAQIFGIEVKECEKQTNIKEDEVEENNTIEENKKIEIFGEGILPNKFEDTIIITETTIKGELREENSSISDAELLFDRMIRLTRILSDKLTYVRNPLKKSNLSLVYDALIEACELKNLKIIVALVMSLNSIAGNERSLRNEIRELNTICYDFYE